MASHCDSKGVAIMRFVTVACFFHHLLYCPKYAQIGAILFVEYAMLVQGHDRSSSAKMHKMVRYRNCHKPNCWKPAILHAKRYEYKNNRQLHKSDGTKALPSHDKAFHQRNGFLNASLTTTRTRHHPTEEQRISSSEVHQGDGNIALTSPRI